MQLLSLVFEITSSAMEEISCFAIINCLLHQCYGNIRYTSTKPFKVAEYSFLFHGSNKLLSNNAIFLKFLSFAFD